MTRKSFVWGGVFMGSLLGGYLPVLFGGSLFSYSSLFGNAIGGILGIWIGNIIADELEI